MKYRYFASYVIIRSKGISFGNTTIDSPIPLTCSDHIHPIEESLLSSNQQDDPEISEIKILSFNLISFRGETVLPVIPGVNFEG